MSLKLTILLELRNFTFMHHMRFHGFVLSTAIFKTPF
jgi:hypothetical protein